MVKVFSFKFIEELRIIYRDLSKLLRLKYYSSTSSRSIRCISNAHIVPMMLSEDLPELWFRCRAVEGPSREGRESETACCEPQS